MTKFTTDIKLPLVIW